MMTAASLPIDRSWDRSWRGECVRHPVTGLAAHRQKVNAFITPSLSFYFFPSTSLSRICVTFTMKSFFIIFISARRRTDTIGTPCEKKKTRFKRDLINDFKDLHYTIVLIHSKKNFLISSLIIFRNSSKDLYNFLWIIFAKFVINANM